MKKRYLTFLFMLCAHCFADNSITFEKQENTSQSPSQTVRVLQFENSQVRVWKTKIFPNQPLKMHRHDYDRIVVTMQGGNLAKLSEDGTIKDRIFESGESYWLEKDPLNELHACVNKSEEPIEVVVIEIK